MQWFEQEIELAHKEGVSHPENLPFFLAPETPSGQAVMLIHGFSATPREMLPLGKILQQHNVTVYGVRLPGHGTDPEDLATRRAEEWVITAEDGYQSLVEMGFKVSIAGLSTGALITLKLALQHHLEKLILLSPFLRLEHFLAPFAGLLGYLIPYQKKDISTDDRPFYYQKRPLKGIAQINRLSKQLNGKLNLITTPSLILTSTGDATIAAGTAEEIHRQLGSNYKAFHCYGDEVPHVLTTAENPQQQDVLQRCVDFLDSSP
ncbi:MAG: alpha/beta fold hydrolase [Thermodesulfobacteriota bacterium]|nr:alpha/beta fold hydrolase [Thermodesulfobacteriota bacterium]